MNTDNSLIAGDEGMVLVSKLDNLINWNRKSSIWYLLVRPGLLRDRADADRRSSGRHRSLRSRSSGHAPPGRPDDRGRHA
jgi:hypothetical protein